MNELVRSEPQNLSVFDQSPRNKVAHFTEMANILREIIVSQGMFSNIQGKEYVKVDAWLTLGTMMGITPREKQVTELPDGSYVAEVELINFATGKVVGGASSLCSVDEKRWGNAEKYARRSMAVTRATGKSYRLAFSWVMMMAGFEATPEEEMPGGSSTITVQKESKPAQRKEVEIYTGTNEQEHGLAEYLEKQGVNPVYFEAIGKQMMGKPKTAIREVMAQVIQ